MKNYTKLLLVAIGILFFTSAKSQFQVVYADPGVGNFTLTDVNGGLVNPIVGGRTYVLKLRVFNSDSVKAIPPYTAYVRIGLGTKFTFDPTYNVSTSPYNQYFTFYAFNSGVQDEFYCVISNPLPANFNGEVSFRIKAKTIAASSTVSANFLIYNQNPSVVLSDYNSGNNTSYVPYTVVLQ